MRGLCSASAGAILAIAFVACAQKTAPAGDRKITDTGHTCAASSDCESGDCLLLSNGESVCTTPCASSSQCVPGWKCEDLPLRTVELCVCDPSPEICDGLDNDCNGLVDDGPGPDEECSEKTPGFSCVNGACTCALRCDGQCVSPDWDSANCGACGRVCPGETGCLDGVCGCAPGKVLCGEVCASLAGSIPNCGACGHACAAGEICSNDECVCPVDEVRCNGLCSNTTFDSSNCGGCGNRCEPDRYCAASQCACLPPLEACTGGCLDLSTDPLNCGSCGRVCVSAVGTAPTCTAGRCTGTVAFADAPVLALTTDATHLYWIESSGPGGASPQGYVKAIPLQGGDVQTLASGNLNPVALAVDATYVYWLSGQTITDGGTSSGAVMAVSLGGGDPFTIAADLNNPLQIASDGTTVYWSSAGLGQEMGTIQSSAVDEDAVTTLTTTGLSTPALAVDNASVYWGGSNGAVVALALDGAVSETLGAGSAVPTAMAVQGGALYWSDSRGDVKEVPITGGPSLVLAAGTLAATALALDQLNVYWTVPGQALDGAVLECAIESGTVVTLASGSRYTGVTVDESGVYYYDQVAGSIMKVSPK